MLKLISSSKFYLRAGRQARFWKPTHYEAIPHYVKPHFIDIHDSYQLRSRQQVEAELSGQEFQIQIKRVVYNETDILADFKGRKAILQIDIQQFNLTQLQLARFKVLVGCRYKEQTGKLKLTCELFDNYKQNHTKIHQMFYELMMDTKRAP